VSDVAVGQGSLLVVGCGALGASMVGACLDSGVATKSSCVILERDSVRREAIRSRFGVRVEPELGAFVREAALIALVVKPQDAESLCQELAPFLSSAQVILSVMAGVSTASLRTWLSGHELVVRAMPNLPARFQEGVSALFCPPELPTQVGAAAERILLSFGRVLRVATEELVDAATAVAGSGPAYFFYLVEQLEVVAEEFGFSTSQARELVRVTMRGSARMLLEDDEASSILRARVTSKGGTTEAALKVLEDRHVAECFREAVRRAFLRAREISSGSK
jgi:pyrroline-5-carboxylate reductase